MWHHLFDWREAPFLFCFCILYSNCLLNFNLCTKCMLLSGECSFEQLSVLLILVCDAYWPSVDILLLFHKEQRPSVAEYLHFILHSSTGRQHLFIALYNFVQLYKCKAHWKNSTVQYVCLGLWWSWTCCNLIFFNVRVKTAEAQV